MSHTLVIDGYNIIFKNPLWRKMSIESARSKLQAFSENSRYPFTVQNIIIVYDAVESSQLCVSQRCKVYYAAPSADVFIQNLIRGNDTPSLISLITDDGELVGTAKCHAVKCYTVRWFLELSQHNNTRHSFQNIAELNKNVSSSQKRIINQELRKRWLSGDD